VIDKYQTGVMSATC